ncbi:hypothetical protein FDP41_001808 [Naegleria fowleri]|uniref:Uncharacterized protein n=1 Tax=Naegleria fowleri TaxID=5763 RepID=A0A6A5C1Q4_NAEFO|nr:uncharacterized protein FDP41_001808 [Naegleria fowleri]KAF0979465.1 hypothetical protein FDP41_001808 [Naegleria fowleri]CAG4710725.1 unnamed protein product [Naegleria fowleri]
MSIQFNARKALEVLADNESEGATREKLKILNQLSTINNVNIIPIEVIQLIVEILGSTENRMIINSILSAIQHLAQFDRTRIVIGENTDCIKLLVPHMSQFNFPNIQSNALDAMAELIKGSKKNQETLIEYASEFFNPLMGIIQRENDTVTKKAIAVLDTLFENPHCVHVIFGDNDRFEEYLEPLIICLQMENNRTVLQWTLQTLESACRQHPIHAKHLVDIGVIDPLVQVVIDPSNFSFPTIRCVAMQTLVHCVKFSNEAGQWAGESGVVTPLIDTMFHTSLELNSKHITQSYALSNETIALREAAFELMMNLTNFVPGKSHTRLLNNSTLLVQNDIDHTTSSEEQKEEKKKETILDSSSSINKSLNPYFDETEEKKQDVDLLEENKKRVISHTHGLDVLFAYVGQADPSEKAEVKEKKHVRNVRKMAIMIISNVCTIAENGIAVLSREQKLLSFDHPMNIVDLLLDIIINKKDKDAAAESKRRATEVSKIDKMDLKQCIINAMGSFALHESCIQKLGEMGVIRNLLKMIDDRNEAAEVAKLLAKMCEHSIFQKVLFEEAGLQRVIKLLDSVDDPEYRMAGLKICLPLASNPNGCVALSRDGIDKRIRDISKREVVFEEVRKLAKQVLKVFKENNKSSLRSTKAAVGASDESGLPIQNMNIFKFNYEQVARIDQDFVEECQKKVRDLLKQPKFRLQINWRQIERLGEMNYSDEAISLLARVDLYDEFVMAVETFIEAAEMNVHVFNSQIQLVVLEVLPPQPKKPGEEDEAVPCELEMGDLVMKYKLSPDGILWTPKQLAGLISYELLGYDIIETNDMLIGDGELDRDDQYELGVEQLRKICKDSRLALLGDINILYFHIEMTDLLWKAGFAESQQIVASRSVISNEELFIKGWRIAKMNKDGMLQERVLLLTNCSFYTVCFDPKSKKIDYKHTKHHNIEDYFLIDIGKLVKSRHDTTSSTVHLHEDGRNKYALNLFTNEKKTSKSQTKLQEEADELEKLKRMSSAYFAPLPTTGGSSGSGNNSEHEDGDHHSSSHTDEDSDLMTETLKNETSFMKTLDLQADDSSHDPERPSTIGKSSTILLCPDSIPRAKQKFYLEEIAWCMRAVASAATRTECHNIYYRDIVKPIEGKLARIYNITGMGKKKDNSFIAKHMETKMRREQEKQEERVRQAQAKGAKNVKGSTASEQK